MNLRHLFRRLRRSPVFTATTLLTLAISIGANTAMFSVLDNVLLKPLPYPEPDRLVGVWLKSAPLHFDVLNMSQSLYVVIKEENRTFSDVGLWNGDRVSVTGKGEPEQIQGLDVTERTLSLLGAQPLLGRLFTAKDAMPGAPETAVLTFGYWRSKFGGDRNILGRHLLVDGRSREIIGVLPGSFHFLDMKPLLIMPYQFDRAKLTLGDFSYRAVARLRPGVTVEQVHADVARLISLSYRKFPPFPGYSVKMFEQAQVEPNVRPFKQDLTGDIGNILWVVMGTMGLVLLIACANIANLWLVRAEGRQHELAIRAALGASAAQISKELLLESVALGVAAGAIGLGLAYLGLRLFVANVHVNLPRLDEISIDVSALVFTLIVSLLCGLFFGLLPVLKFAGLRLTSALRAGGRNSSQSREQHRARSLLVVVQVALALVLLISSGLMIRTFQALRRVQPGFTNPDQVQTLRLFIPEAQVKDPVMVMQVEKQMLQALGGIPGVSSVALLQTIPMDGNSSSDAVFAEDHQYREGQLPPIRRFNFVSPGTFQALGNPLIAGRDFTWNDLDNFQPVAVVSENVARELWADPSKAIGKRIRENTKGPWRTIVGVVHDSYNDGVGEKAPSLIYWPAILKDFQGDAISVRRGVGFTIRSGRTGSQQFLSAIRQAIWSVNSNLPLADVRSMQDVYDRSMARTSLTLSMLAIAGAMALLLGVVGIYGVISYSVMQRTREIGVRIAVGAQQQQVTGMFVRHGLMLACIGVSSGLVVAILLSRLLSSLLFGVKAFDPLTYAVVGIGLISCSLLASYFPARRVSSVNPVEALRAE